MGAVVKGTGVLLGSRDERPVKVTQLILRLADRDDLPAHLLIGSDAVEYTGQAEATRTAEAARWREFSVSTDVDANVAAGRSYTANA